MIEKNLEKRENDIIKMVKEFSNKPLELINKISLEDLIEKGGINAYFVKSLGFQTIDEIVEFFLLRRVERSLVTSFGTVLEKFVRILVDGNDGKDIDPKCRQRKVKPKPWICWWDVVVDRPFEEEGKNWKGIVIAVKSGPADMDKDQVEHFADRAIDAETRDYRPYLVFVYGKEAWSVIPKTLGDKGLAPERYLVIGRQIFEKFINESNYYTKALELFGKGGLSEDLFEIIKRKKQELVLKLKEKYGENLETLLQDTF